MTAQLMLGGGRWVAGAGWLRAAPHLIGGHATTGSASGICKNGVVRQSRATRTLRGVIAAAFATFVAVLSHLAGGGELPGTWGVVAPLTLSILVSVFLSGRRLSLWRLSASVGVSQFLFHGLFMLGTTTALAQSATDLGAHAAHAGHATGALAVTGLASVPAPHLEHGGGLMWLAHAGAALLTIAMLHRGETVLATLAQSVEYVLVRVMPAVVVPALPVRRATPSAAAQWFEKALTPPGYFASAAQRRGPPRPSCSMA